jgi:hypothetical protein
LPEFDETIIISRQMSLNTEITNFIKIRAGGRTDRLDEAISHFFFAIYLKSLMTHILPYLAPPLHIATGKAL